MHITGQAGIQLSGCDWHSVILNHTVDIAFEEDEKEKIDNFVKEVLRGDTTGLRFMPSLSNIFGDSHLYERKADNYLPFDYICADCVRSYIEFINYLILKLGKRFKDDTGKFPFTVFQYLFDEKQEEKIFFYLDKLKDSYKDEEQKVILQEFIDYCKKELQNV